MAQEKSVTIDVPVTSSINDTSINDAAKEVIHNNNFDIDLNVDISKLVDFLSNTFHHEPNWLQDHQILLTGLCAIVAAGLAVWGSKCLARGQIDAGLKLDEQKSTREEAAKKKAWEGKKRFLVFDILNASTDASKYIHYAAGYIHNFLDDDQPTEYIIFRKEIAFGDIDKALDRISIRSSFYPFKEEELCYLTDEEMNVIKKLDFYVAFLKSKSMDMREIWQRFVNYYVPEEILTNASQPPEDIEKTLSIQKDMYVLVKKEIEILASEAIVLENQALNFAKILAPEIGEEWDAAKNKNEEIKKSKNVVQT